MHLLDEMVGRIENWDGLDGVTEKVSATVARVTHRPPVSSALSGTWLGHPLHPVLTDLPIGCWTSAFMLDLVGGKTGRRAARSFVGLGVATAIPTVMTGLSDWADTVGGTRRIGTAHALINTTGLGCYVLSWRARRRGHHLRGVALGMLGATVVTVGAHLGGHLVYRTGTGIDVNVLDPGPSDWTSPARAPVPLDGGAGAYLDTGAGGVLATRHDGTWHGIGARCSHRGGPLHEGTFDGDCVECPWHHSRFRLDDGSIVNGPATAPQPRYEVRERDDVMAVRAAR